jgi:L-alanine-DL-glutamate epimerase-like enolase superfamily enzyme
VDVPNPYSLDEYNRTLNMNEIDFMVSLVSAFRKEAGNGIDLSIDCHWRYNTNDVMKLAWELEPYHLLWLEDPIPPENTKALKTIT